MTKAQTSRVFHTERLSGGGPSSRQSSQDGEAELGLGACGAERGCRKGCGKGLRSQEKARNSILGALGGRGMGPDTET